MDRVILMKKNNNMKHNKTKMNYSLYSLLQLEIMQ